LGLAKPRASASAKGNGKFAKRTPYAIEEEPLSEKGSSRMSAF
jgi:hypothetical protein